MRRLLGLLIFGLLIIGGLTGCATTEFEVGPISVTPDEVVAGNTFTVEADISNIGENDGTFTATLKLDEGVFDEKKVMVAAGVTETVRFDCVEETPGVHSLGLNDSTATFTALKPADFEVTFLSIPAEAYPREAIVIEANVTNIGEVEGIYNARLMVNGIEAASRDTPIAPGATEVISFTIIIDIPGTYNINLDGTIVTLTVFLAFPDSNLEAAIRENLNKPEGTIYTSDMETITVLEADDRGISDLTGLEFCTNLQELTLWQNSISNISPLAGLTNLETLYLKSNNISDISPLAGLTNLDKLNLENNNISDLSPLAGLVNLNYLELEGSNISDISPLAELVDLQHLRLENNNISDISPLTSLTKLVNLDLQNNNISDIPPLAGLTNLYSLNLENNNISDISALAGLINLPHLRLIDNNISDISSLASLTNLETLFLGNNNISDISPLAGLTNLNMLDLQKNNISDILSLVQNSGFTAGNQIGLQYNPLSTISINTYIPQLEARGIEIGSNYEHTT